MSAPALVEFAPAKINLTLRVIGRRADGYHELESLVVFARPRDRLRFTPGGATTLSVQGPTAVAAGDGADNLVLKAARALQALVPGLVLGHFELWKTLPVAAGIGGGSSDAAAALRLLARANGLAPDDARLMEAARRTGADVPVCLDPRPRVMRGIGEKLSEAFVLPALPAVLVNPRVAVPTADVFRTLAALRDNEGTQDMGADAAALAVEAATSAPTTESLIAAVTASRNDLERPAISVQPVVADVLAALRELDGCLLTRMSGSGATCFALFERRTVARAARQLRTRHPAWWIKATTLGAG